MNTRTMNMNYEELKEQWWDNIQGGKGIIRMVSEIDAKNERNYYMKEPVTLSDGTNIVVCNQWGKENFSNFILQAGLLNYEIIADVNDSDSSENDTSAKAETQSSEEVVIEKSESSTAAVSSGWSVMQPDWGMPHALAYLIRHVMVVDGSVEEGELNWMQKAFEEYDKYKIDVREYSLLDHYLLLAFLMKSILMPFKLKMLLQYQTELLVQSYKMMMSLATHQRTLVELV